jgi:hypothetical protein
MDTELKTPGSYMLGQLFFRLRSSCEHLNRMINAVKIRVCSVVNTDLVAILLCRLRDADRVHLCEPVPNPAGELGGIIGRHQQVVRSGCAEVSNDQKHTEGIRSKTLRFLWRRFQLLLRTVLIQH